jgi:biopolymer transport protein ExbD
MSMNVGSGGGSGDPDVMIDINTTPLIDVMLVLLVMLIITIPIQLHSVNLNMPTGNPPPPLVKPEVVKIDIDGNGSISWDGKLEPGTIYWNGEAVADRATLEEKLKTAAAQAPQPELHLRPDKGAKYELAAGVMASSQRLGLTKIGIVGSEQFIEE